MARTTHHPKEESFNFRVSADLKAEFKAAAEAADRPAAQLLRDFMRAYVEENQRPEPGYDSWFRAKVREALRDHRPTVPHEEVEKHFAKRRASALRKATPRRS